MDKLKPTSFAMTLCHSTYIGFTVMAVEVFFYWAVEKNLFVNKILGSRNTQGQ